MGLASSDIEGKRYHAPFIAIKLLSGLISSLARAGRPEDRIIVAGTVRNFAMGHQYGDGSCASTIRDCSLGLFGLLTLDEELLVPHAAVPDRLFWGLFFGLCPAVIAGSALPTDESMETAPKQNGRIAHQQNLLRQKHEGRQFFRRPQCNERGLLARG